jgi:hypothetical protein
MVVCSPQVGDLETVVRLVEMDPRLVHHAPMYHGWTPLMKAVSKGHLEASTFLIRKFKLCI